MKKRIPNLGLGSGFLSTKQVYFFIGGFFFGWGLFMFASGIIVGLAING